MCWKSRSSTSLSAGGQQRCHEHDRADCDRAGARHLAMIDQVKNAESDHHEGEQDGHASTAQRVGRAEASHPPATAWSPRGDRYRSVSEAEPALSTAVYDAQVWGGGVYQVMAVGF